MGRLRVKRVLQVAVPVALAAAAAVVPAGTGSAAPTVPTLKVVSVLHKATIDRFGGGILYTNLGIYLAAQGGPFEIDANRERGGGIALTQVRRTGGAYGTVSVLRRLPDDPGTSFANGLGHFLSLTWVDSHGNVALQQQVPFCPASYASARINDSGPVLPIYPDYCGGSSRTNGAVWGIDRGWAVQALGNGLPDPGTTRLPNGTYTLEIAIRGAWVRALHITGPVSASASVTLEDFSGCVDVCPPGEAAQLAAAQQGAHEEPAIVTGTGKPDVAGPKPDLRPLRAWHIVVQHNKRNDSDLLTFAATVWNRGRGPLLVEGYRSSQRPWMRAIQYFMSHGKVVSKAHVGQLHYDSRRGHNHWHFEDFAHYQLINVKTDKVIRSTKQSFCLAPTDPVNLTLPAADWQPGSTGLYSACGDDQSIWIRETLQVGWGDTYFQSVAGQAFVITDLPNGTYDLRVTANPGHHLYETRYGNDVTDRRLRLSGTPGNRTVTLLG